MKFKSLTAFFLTLFGTNAMADILATGGGVVRIPPPPSAVINTLESDTEIRAFNERQRVTLLAPLGVNISAAGVYDDPADLTPAVIPAGTVIDSHMIHYDIFFTGVGITQTGTVTFRDRILGIITDDFAVDATDGLGAPTAYTPSGLSFRGLDLDLNDVIEVGCNTVRVELEALEILDNVRVITAANSLCGQGCDVGFWKQCIGKKSARRRAQMLAAGFSPDANINTTFGTTIFPNVSLCEATNLKAGGVRTLARNAVAALLDASHPDIDYALTPEEVRGLVAAGDSATLEAFNRLRCPLP